MSSFSQLEKAKEAFVSGGLIAYPTESVFGLGCNPFNQQAVLKLLTLKQRAVEKGLILIASHIRQILPLIKPKHADDLARALKTWPGHNTWIFPKTSKVPEWVSGSFETIAVRVSKHEAVVQLCNYLNSPLVSTSANLANQPVLNSIKDIKDVFGDKILCYFDAPLGKEQKPSTIRDASTNQIIR